jgi:hypothetical protein
MPRTIQVYRNKRDEHNAYFQPVFEIMDEFEHDPDDVMTWDQLALSVEPKDDPYRTGELLIVVDGGSAVVLRVRQELRQLT